MGAGGTNPIEDAELSKLICTNPGCPHHIQEIPMLGVHCDPRVHPQMWFAQEDFLILKRLCSLSLDSDLGPDLLSLLSCPWDPGPSGWYPLCFGFPTCNVEIM